MEVMFNCTHSHRVSSISHASNTGVLTYCYSFLTIMIAQVCAFKQSSHALYRDVINDRFQQSSGQRS